MAPKQGTLEWEIWRERLKQAGTGVKDGPYRGRTTYTEGTIRSGATKEWFDFKEKVLERDKYTCQWTGCSITQADLDLQTWLKGSAKSLNIHHRLPYNRFRNYYEQDSSLYLKLEAVITFCRFHHLKEDWRLARLSDEEILLEYVVLVGNLPSFQVVS